MAADTRDKRFSMIGIVSPIVRLMQNPTGTIGALARAMLEFLYAGILPAGPPVGHPRAINLISRADNSLTLLSRADNAIALRSSTV